MIKKKLLILDLNEDKKYIAKNNYDIIKINFGNISYNNSKLLNYTLKKTNIENNKKKIRKLFKEIYNKIDKKKLSFNPLELEFFNLRHDKVKYLDKLFFLNFLKNNLVRKYRNIEIISDDYSFLEIVCKKYPKIKKYNLDRNSLNKNFYVSHCYYLLKLFLITLLSKIFLKKLDFYTKQMNISIYPHFFKKKKNYLYKNNFFNINFLLGEEIQNSFNLKKLIISFFQISKNNKIIFSEAYIGLLDIIRCLKKNLINYKYIKHLPKHKILYCGYDITPIIKKNLYLTFFNRSKLVYYENSLKKIILKYKPIKINYYMFEYSFGFFISNLIFSINNRIIRQGYQHGIFTKKIMWLDLLNNKINRLKFLPDNILYIHQVSKMAYLKFKKNKALLKNNFYKSSELNNIKKIACKNSKNILVFMGLHDWKDNLEFMINYSNSKKNKLKNFFIKFHPKLEIKKQKFYLPDNFTVVRKKIPILNFEIFASQSSSLLYKMQEKRIPCNKIGYMYKFNLL